MEKKLEQEKEDEFIELTTIDLEKGSLSKYKAKIPSLIYHYGLIDNQLRDQLAVVVNKHKFLVSSVKRGLRSKYKRSKLSITETELNELVMVSEDYNQIKTYEFKMRRLDNLLRLSKLRLGVLRDKRDMLIHIAHNERLEKSSKIR